MILEAQAQLGICPKAADGVHQYFEIKKIGKYSPLVEKINDDVQRNNRMTAEAWKEDNTSPLRFEDIPFYASWLLYEEVNHDAEWVAHGEDTRVSLPSETDTVGHDSFKVPGTNNLLDKG